MTDTISNLTEANLPGMCNERDAQRRASAIDSTSAGMWTDDAASGCLSMRSPTCPIPRLPQYLAESRGLGCAICLRHRLVRSWARYIGPLQEKRSAM